MILRSKLVALGGCLLASMAASCAAEHAGGDEDTGSIAQAVLLPPPDPASGDIVDSTTYLGALPTGGAVTAHFNQNPEHFSWHTRLPAGATVRLEVTHLGSSMYLDTGLFLYGPRSADGSYGTTLVAQDDDAGYGLLSKINWLTLSTGGDYLAVVGAHSGAGKKFRLALTCLNGQCDNIDAISLAPQPVSAALDAQIAAADQACNSCSGSLTSYSFAWPYAVPPPFAQAVAAAKALPELDYHQFWDHGEILLAQLEQFALQPFVSVVPELLSELGDGVEAVQVNRLRATYPVAPGSDAFHNAYILYFPDSHRVAVLEQVVYD